MHEALIATSGHIPPSLLELHLGATGDSVDNREDVKPAGTKKAPVKLKGLAKMVNVRALDDRGDQWEGELEDRVSSTLRSRAPRSLRTPSPSARTAIQSPLSSPNAPFLSTQPLGDSDLANRYARHVTPEIDSTTPEPELDDLIETTMPPSSQKRRPEVDQENSDPASEEEMPFRKRGGPRAAGGLPNSPRRSIIWQDWGCKRYRADGYAC